MLVLFTLIVFVLSVAFLAWLLISLKLENQMLRAEKELPRKEALETALKLELCKREIASVCRDMTAEPLDLFLPFIKRLEHLDSVIDPYRLGDWRKSKTNWFEKMKIREKSLEEVADAPPGG